MLICRTPQQISIQAPAKLNLFLEVLGKRSDGFHEIETVMCPISLFDRLVCRSTDDPQIVLDLKLPQTASLASNTKTDPAWDIPEGPSNLVVRAATVVQRELGTRQGCRIELEKSIPAAAGLGGGSSDAAAVVVACLCLWDTWDRDLATRVCASLGSDIAFFLGDTSGFGLSLARGRGEQCVSIPARPDLYFVVSHPPAGCSTRKVYEGCVVDQAPRHFAKIVSACEDGLFQKIGAELFNALQLPASNVTDWIPQQMNLFAKCGARYAMMTGSGSSCFAMLEDLQAQAAMLEKATRYSETIGLTRLFPVQAWYGDAVEQQLVAPFGEW